MLELIWMSLGLAMDSFAVCIAAGALTQTLGWPTRIKMAIIFGLFQGGMPLVGYGTSLVFQKTIQDWDHWVAFFLLIGIGTKMIWESLKVHEERNLNFSNLFLLLALALATSIDAMVVGVTFSIIEVPLHTALLCIGLITFSLCILGPTMGKHLGSLFGNKVEMAGGILLGSLGTQILLTHTGVL